ncbi:copper resistance CopC family protein [Paractinoplanes lichenicola]|uniref:Copper resistance protein CopC n=1 Tax=Paractinoplanes lichenicola TaxID=2802976 RepID=A0ABS1VYI5_9ACTN|nr:copper resistance CopC family protein [Actinoplanes lichenicola]MBL7259545.1 copper resistance protein CopC [Actinoplanes lichenicola]
MRRVLVALAAVVAVLLPSSPAWAHAQLLSSAPAAGAALAASPAVVTLRFSEELNPSFITIVLSDAAQQRVPAGAPVVAAATATVAVDSPVENGAYTVAYRVVSKDGHTVQGSYAFTVGSVSSVAPTPVAVAVRESNGIPTGVLIGLGVVGAALIGLAAYFALTGRRRAPVE